MFSTFHGGLQEDNEPRKRQDDISSNCPNNCDSFRQAKVLKAEEYILVRGRPVRTCWISSA